MGSLKGCSVVAFLGLLAIGAVTADMTAMGAPNKEALKAMREKCSREADAKGLDVKSGKKDARRDFRRACLKKMGVSPKT